MGDEVIPPKRRQGLPVPALFAGLGVEPVTQEDSFTIEYNHGLMTATINRADGPVEVVRRSVGHSGFTETTSFDPSAMTQEQRNHLIRTFSAARMTQSEIARRMGIAQTTVGNVLRKPR